MKITQEMLQAAMQKAVETGIVPKYTDGDTYLRNWEAMREVLQASFDASDKCHPNGVMDSNSEKRYRMIDIVDGR